MGDRGMKSGHNHNTAGDNKGPVTAPAPRRALWGFIPCSIRVRKQKAGAVQK